MATTVVTGGPETLVNTTTASHQARPTVATLADGGYVVAWFAYVGIDYGSDIDIYAQRYDANGNALGGETLVNTTTADWQIYPVVAALSGGGYIIVWQSQKDGFYDIYAQRYDANGSAIGVETLINTSTAGQQSDPAVAGLADGSYVITWGSGLDIYAKRYDGDGNELGSETRFSSTLSGNPAIAALPDGSYVITWTSAVVAAPSDVHAQRYDANGNALGGETLINTTTVGDQGSPVVVGLIGGGYVVAWTSYDQDGSGPGIYLQQYDANGSRVGSETRVNTFTTANQDHAALAALSDGGYIVTWESAVRSGFGNEIYSQRYDASGNALGGEIQVNLTTEDDQSEPAVAALANGSYVVSWISRASSVCRSRR
jgi:hypothetical protein